MGHSPLEGSLLLLFAGCGVSSAVSCWVPGDAHGPVQGRHSGVADMRRGDQVTCLPVASGVDRRGVGDSVGPQFCSPGLLLGHSAVTGLLSQMPCEV